MGLLQQVLFKKSGHKIVLFDRGFGDALVPSVIVNNKVGASMAIEKLIAARKKNIGFITLTPSHISPLKDRRSGFMEAMKKHKLPVSEKNICEIKFDQVEDHSQQVLGNWFKQNPTLDAVLVAIDEIY
jgi:DNA-binding LacI/PurR family transcriptional regulator